MSITALEIQNEGFEHSLRGYDVEQVDVFLEHVADEVDEMNKTIDSLKAQLKEANEKLSEQPAEPSEPVEQKPEPEPEKAPEPVVIHEDEKERAQLQAAVKAAEAETDKANRKLADALVRVEEAETRARHAENRATKAEKDIEPLKKQLEEKSKLDSAISEAFISAQRSADALKEEARAEGDRIYRESEAKAREFIREALAKKAALFQEIDALQKSADEFRDQYIELVGKFAGEAKDNFRDMPEPEIPEGVVNELLPDIDSMPISPEEADTRPQLDTDSIPKIDEPDE